jgi:hypothetical protein
MCSACHRVVPRVSNSAVEQSRRSLMLVKKLARTDASPISSTIDEGAADHLDRDRVDAVGQPIVLEGAHHSSFTICAARPTAEHADDLGARHSHSEHSNRKLGKGPPS